MSADNLLVVIPAARGHLALYDVPLSSLGVDLDGPRHEACAHIARQYAKRQVGVYATVSDMEKAAEKYREEVCVEYGLLDLASPAQPAAMKPR